MILKSLLLCLAVRIIHIEGHIVRKGIRVLQHTTAFDELLIGRLEKFDVSPQAIVALLLQNHHPRSRFLELALGEFLRLGMGVVAFVIVQIAIQLPLGLGSVGHVRRIVVGIKLIAAIVAAGVGSVIGPVAHADPAELVSAGLARHVVAALVLFNAGRTFGTGLGIGQDPVGRLRLVLALLIPRRQLPTPGRGVRLIATLEAEVSVARVALGHESARGSRVQHLLGADGNALASGSRTPAGEGVALDKVAELVGLEFRVGVRSEGLVFFLGDDLLATGLRTGLADAHGAIGQGNIQKSSPAVPAELVAAGHAEHLVRAEAILVVTDAALLLLRLLLLLGGPGRTAVGCGSRLLVAVVVAAAAAFAVAGTGQNTARFEELVGIVVKGLEESFLGPLVFSHEGGGCTGGDVEDLGHLLQSVIHDGDKILGVEHPDGIGLVGWDG